MKTNPARRALIAIAAIAAIALSACTEGPAGLFASIASETPTNTNMTKAIKNSSQSFVVRLGSTSTYYAGIGTLWKKADTDNRWTQADTSGVSSSTIFAGSAAVIGPDMYVAFFDSATGNGLGVWSYNGTIWSHVDPGFPAAGRDLRTLLVANGKLFAVTANTRTLTTEIADYSIHHLLGTTFEDTLIDSNPTISEQPTSMAFSGGLYWFTAGDLILNGATETSFTAIGTEPPSGSAYSGVSANGADIYISSRTGYLYHYNAGWLTAGPFNDSKGKAYSLSTPTYIAGSNVLVVGTNRIPTSSTPTVDGYLEFDMTQPFATMTPTVDHGIISNANNFDTSLTGRSVSATPLIDLGGGDFKLFALTNNYGLWSNTYDSAEAAWQLWVRE